MPQRSTLIFSVLAAAVLAGCASKPTTDTAAKCDLMVRKDVPGGTTVDECVMWSMAPSRRQAAIADHKQLLEPQLQRGAPIQYPWSKPR